MISYDPFWKTVDRKGENIYKLFDRHNLSATIINRIQHNENMSTKTINRLCEILNCDVCDIIEYKTENGDPPTNKELQFMYDYAKNTNFKPHVVTRQSVTGPIETYSPPMHTLQSLYNAYCARNNIVYDELNNETYAIIGALHAILKDNKTFPYKHELTLIPFLFSTGKYE